MWTSQVNPANGNNVTSQASADVQAQEAKILVTKTANPTAGTPGTNVTFTLVVNNTGSSDLQHVFVSDLLPAGMTYVSSTSGERARRPKCLLVQISVPFYPATENRCR